MKEKTPLSHKVVCLSIPIVSTACKVRSKLFGFLTDEEEEEDDDDDVDEGGETEMSLQQLAMGDIEDEGDDDDDIEEWKPKDG